MSFFPGIFTGSNPTLSGDISNAGSINNFTTNLGQNNLNTASNFWNTILGGNQQAIGQLLGPQISNIQKQGQQQLNTNAQFGNRSGGTNASNQTNLDSQRQQVEQLIGQLTGQAAGQVGSLGEFGINSGLEANQLQSQEAQERLQNEQNSILGNIFGEVAGGATTAGLGLLGI